MTETGRTNSRGATASVAQDPFQPTDLETISSYYYQQVAQYGHHIAVRSSELCLTYGQLDQRANAIARILFERTENQDTPIAILANNVAEFVPAMLGALKAGRTIVPLDIMLPPERLLFILKDAGCELVLTDGETNDLSGLALPDACRVLSIKGTTPCSEQPVTSVTPEKSAFVLYTSGSTGTPKGVIWSHAAVLYGVRIYTNSMKIRASDRHTMLFSVMFGLAIKDILCALLNGAALHIWDKGSAGMVGLARWLIDEQITVYHSVPTLFRSLLGQCNKHMFFPEVRVVHLAGESVVSNDLVLFKRHFASGCKMINTYGSVEANTISQYFMDHKTRLDQRIAPAGYPVAGVTVKVVDDDGQELLSGSTGELVVGGRLLASGYLNRPELDDRWSVSGPNQEISYYRTGDLGRILPDGLIELAGRKDDQIKVRGFRIEIGEIEAALRAHPEVKQAAVALRQLDAVDPQLVAYIVPESREALPTGLRAYLSNTIPSYMIPVRYVSLGELPFTVTGKIDRNALPRPGSDIGSQNYVPPRTPLEKELAAIWSEVLGVGRIGVKDEFLTLGGESIQAFQIIDRILQRFDLQLAVSSIFDAATVEAQARLCNGELLKKNGK